MAETFDNLRLEKTWSRQRALAVPTKMLQKGVQKPAGAAGGEVLGSALPGWGGSGRAVNAPRGRLRGGGAGAASRPCLRSRPRLGGMPGMEEAHRAALLAASCLRTPLDPRTRAPAALYERGAPPAAAQDGFDLDSNTSREQTSPPKRDCDEWIDFSKVYNSNQEYYLKLEELKNAHMETMAKLESMYQNKLYLKGVQTLDKSNDASPKCCRPTWDKSSYQPLNLHKSFSDSDLSDPLGSSVSDESDKELAFEGNGSETGSSSFAKQQIEKMWDGFCLEDYISRAKHSLPSSPTGRKVRKKHKVWSPRVTVPKPFQMTIREAQKKEQNIKSKSQIELENHLLKKQLEEEAECQKKFRANPVPAAVFLPLYHDIVQRNEERRRSVKERCKLKLLASQKPFKFIERERQRSEMRKMQLKDISLPENKTKVFRAKPVPKCVYSPDFNDRLKEEELCREIRIRMRAEELLQNSSVPNSRLALKETNKKKKHKSTEPKRPEHKPKVKPSVPDFELLHEKFQKRLLKKKKVKPLTVCEPFDLCTSYIPSKKDKILKDIQEDEEKLKETRWPFASPRRKPQMGQSGANPFLLGGKSKSPKNTESTRQRLQAIRNNEKQRRREYLKELREMEERVKQMPLLFERVTQKNARIAAEKYYSNRLKALGICPEFVSKKGGAAKSLQFSTPRDFTSVAVRQSIIKVKKKKRKSFEEAAGDNPQSEQSWEEEEEEKGRGVKTSTPDEQGSDLEDGDEARASPDVLEPESSWHREEEEEEAKSGPSLGHSQQEEEEEEEEDKADLSLGYSQEEEEEEEEEAKAGLSLDHSQEEEEEEAKAGPSRGQSQEEEEEEEEEEDESRASSGSDRSHEHDEAAQSDPEAEGAFQYEDEEYESDDFEEKPSDEEGE
ncbi:protein FAM161A-like isoform X2 [Poecile atricapillus]|uniref:protein FAM161A-like isoform X2 n=1 Tax=Poecile atricapillus TaxID=48891 RepID=UPI0027382DAA|nr:protein FAM161A-like isoform X2 [Poecile atricapillus]